MFSTLHQRFRVCIVKIQDFNDEQTLQENIRDYVMTDRVAAKMARLVDRIVISCERQEAGEGHYLHSSFGAGKWHSMAILGMNGLDVNDSTPRYRLRSLPGEFSGLHLVAVQYVGFKQINPQTDIGFDLAQEYEMAVSLHSQKKAAGSRCNAYGDAVRYRTGLANGPRRG